jgi:hypothetical protein
VARSDRDLTTDVSPLDPTDDVWVLRREVLRHCVKACQPPSLGEDLFPLLGPSKLHPDTGGVYKTGGREAEKQGMQTSTYREVVNRISLCPARHDNDRAAVC